MSRRILDKLILISPLLLVLGVIAFSALTLGSVLRPMPLLLGGGLVALGLAVLALYNMRTMKLLQAANLGLNAELVERKIEDERVRAMAFEKELLLKELQHRVKNSMSIITSLVGLEESKADTPRAREVLAKLESRVTALSCLYDILCDEGGIDSVELADYLGRVVDSVAEGLGADAKGIAFDRAIEPGAIDVKRALSLGLIVNELVTDSLKYAFPGGPWRPGGRGPRARRLGHPPRSLRRRGRLPPGLRSCGGGGLRSQPRRPPRRAARRRVLRSERGRRQVPAQDAGLV